MTVTHLSDLVYLPLSLLHRVLPCAENIFRIKYNYRLRNEKAPTVFKIAMPRLVDLSSVVRLHEEEEGTPRVQILRQSVVQQADNKFSRNN